MPIIIVFGLALSSMSIVALNSCSGAMYVLNDTDWDKPTSKCTCTMLASLWFMLTSSELNLHLGNFLFTDLVLNKLWKICFHINFKIYARQPSNLGDCQSCESTEQQI